MKKAYFILYIENQEKSTSFYSQLLASEPILNVPGMTEFQLTKSSILGLMPSSGIKHLLSDKLSDPAEGKGIPRADLYIVVDDPEKYLLRAISSGALEISPVIERDWGHRAGYCTDPDGHVIAFAEIINSNDT